MTKNKELANIIINMTFGELTSFAGEIQECTEVSWRSYTDEAYGPIHFASALHSWAVVELQDDEE